MINLKLYKTNGRMRADAEAVAIKAYRQTNKVERYYLKTWGYHWAKCNEGLYRSMIELCKEFKLDYTLGNSARGGASSDYIEIKRDGRKPFYKKQLKDILNVPIGKVA